MSQTLAPGSCALRAVYRVEDMTLAIALGALVVLAAAQILLRMAFDAGFLWLEPLLRILVLWVALLGAMVAAREGRHIGLDIVEKLLPTAILRVVRFIAFGFAAVISGLLAWHALRMVMDEYAIGTTAFASVPAWVTQAILPFALAVIALRLFLCAIWPPPALEGLPGEPERAA